MASATDLAQNFHDAQDLTMSTDEHRVVRRRRGPFKRSRTGCGTCKRRGKKCDEMWSPEGYCQRCLAGPWDCTGRTAGPSSSGPSSSPTSSQNRPQEAGTGEASSSGAVDLHISTGHNQASHAGLAAHSISPLTSLAPALTPTSAVPVTGLSPTGMLDSSRNNSITSGISTSPLASAPGAMGGVRHPHTQQILNQHAMHGHAANPNPLPPHPTDSLPHFTGLWNGFLNHTDSRPFQGYQPLFDWPAGVQGGGMPSAVLRTCEDGSLAIDAPAPQPQVNVDTSVVEFWNDLSASFSADTGGQQPSFNPSSRVLFLSSDRPMRQGVSLAEIYARVVESWLVGLPNQTRDYARARILALHDKNSVMRAVRYAVAAAYIYLFASDPHSDTGEPGNPKPKLVELAIRGAGLPDSNGASGSPQGSANSSTPGSQISIEKMEKMGPGGKPMPCTEPTGGGAVRKIRLYVDQISAPFAADLESTKWTEDAVQELRQTVVTSRQQLSDLLWGVVDLQLVEFIRGGAEPSYNMLALGDRLVRQFFGSEHPPLKLSDVRNPETFSLRLFALSDLSRCIVHRGRRTIFNFEGDSDSPAVDAEEEPWSTYLGLPDNIVVLLAAITNLCAELVHISGSSLPAGAAARADEIEHELRNWTPAVPSSSVGVDSRALVSRTIAGELWRNAALVLLYQSVHRVGMLHPVLRRAHGEILSLLASVTNLPNGDLWGFIALPAFLAACLSTSCEDRKRSLGYMIRTGPERVWLDNIALVEKVWEETDRSGHLVEWHELMVREGMSVAFF